VTAVRHNLIAAAGGLFRPPPAIGRAAVRDAILTGEPIDAGRAFDLGQIVSAVPLDDLLTSEDAGKGLAACAEKREPQWQGR
jgi:enoyl-CoA hydratase/carnithine racemase